MSRKPNKKAHFSQEKKPRAIAQNKERLAYNVNVLDHHPVWQLKSIDFSHSEWVWRNFSGTLVKEVLEKLAHFESMKWKEIFFDKTRNHSVSVSQLDTAAQKRLVELEQDDTNELFRFRLTGKQRIWGILDGYIFKVLWWDPEHKICPSNKKHT